MAGAGRRRRSSRRQAAAGTALGALLALVAAWPALADPPRGRDHLNRVCELIALHADRNDLPRPFLARLIWKESRFDPNAVSPAGAEGIAQFMPGTAKMRGLADPFDPEQALPASARYLGELRRSFGNLGLAAAAYNAGESRVGRWLARGGFLPLETEDYVLDILGEPADSFSDAAYQGTVRPLAEDKGFGESCRALPVLARRTVPMASIATKPWGVQVAGNFSRAAAVRQWERLRRRMGSLLAEQRPVVSRVRSARGRRGIYAVRLGADSRPDADVLCRQLRGAGGSCVVLRNR